MDDLKQCNEKVGKVDSRRFATNESSVISLWSSKGENKTRSRQYFPFKLGYLSVMTLRVGEEGFQMTVDGKHITTFAYREVISLFFLFFIYIYIYKCYFLCFPLNQFTFYEDVLGSGAMACE